MKNKRLIVAISFIVLIGSLIFYTSQYIKKQKKLTHSIVENLDQLNIKINEFNISNAVLLNINDTQRQVMKFVINDADKINFIKFIKGEKNFKKLNTVENVLNDSTLKELSKENAFFNFEFPDKYTREILKPINGKPTRILLTIYHDDNTLELSKMTQ